MRQITSPNRSTPLCLALAVLATAALLAACGGGGSGDTPADPPAASNGPDVPASASASDDAFVAWANAQPTSETAEPLRLDGVMPPASETDEPKAVR